MKYDGNIVGPNLRQLRKMKKMTVDEVSEMTGLSISTIKQLEQGGRRLSISSLYLFMDVYQCDANTLLNITGKDSKEVFGLDVRKLSISEKEKCIHIFGTLIEMLVAKGDLK